MEIAISSPSIKVTLVMKKKLQVLAKVEHLIAIFLENDGRGKSQVEFALMPHQEIARSRFCTLCVEIIE